MQKFFVDQICHMWDKYGLEVIINDGEVLGFEKFNVNVRRRSFDYFVFVDRHKYNGE